METRNGTGPAYSEGLAAYFDVSAALDAFLSGLAETNPDAFATPGPPGTEDADTLAWQYQYCTEFGMLLFRPGFVAWSDWMHVHRFLHRC
jgi:hypothetical protein